MLDAVRQAAGDGLAKKTAAMPPKFISKEGNHVTRAFVDYARPLVGELPPMGFLAGKPARKVKV